MLFPDGGNDEYRTRKKVKGEYAWGSIIVRSLKGGRLILLEGSPAMYLQGHNAFASNGVFSLCYMAACKALRAVGLRFDADALSKAVRRARVARLDLSCALKLPPGVPVGPVIEELQIALTRAGNDVNAYRDETAVMPSSYAPRNLFYDKAKDMEKRLSKRWREGGFEGAEYLAGKLDGVIRFETQLKRQWLKAKRLDRVASWTSELARAVLTEQLERSFVRGNLKVRRWPALYYEIDNNELRTTFALWLAGFDLSLHKKRRALLYHRKALLEHGVDIRWSSRGIPMADIEIADVLRDAKRWLSFTKGARERGLIALRDNFAP